QARIFAQGVGEVARNVSIAHRRRLRSESSASAGPSMAVVPLLIDIGAARHIGLLRRVLQLAIEVIVECGDEGARDSCARRILAGVLTGGVDIGTFEARIVAADDHALVTQQFLTESCGT